MLSNEERLEQQRKADTERRRRIYNGTHCATSVDKVPTGSHYAVLVNESSTDDDGYGGLATRNYLSYVYFDSDEALESWIIENHSKKTFKVIKVQAVEFEMKTSISVKP